MHAAPLFVLFTCALPMHAVLHIKTFKRGERPVLFIPIFFTSRITIYLETTERDERVVLFIGYCSYPSETFKRAERVVLFIGYCLYHLFNLTYHYLSTVLTR